MIPGAGAMRAEHEADEVLFARTRRGDGLAFAALVTRHWNSVHRVAWNMLPGTEAAGEVAEATFLSALRSEGAFANVVSFRTALLREAMRHVLKRARSGATRALGAYLPKFDAHGRLVASTTDWTLATGAAFGGEEVADAIRSILLGLDVLDRAAFVLRVIEQMQMEEAAAVLGIPVEDMRLRTHRASLVLTGFIAELFESSRVAQPS